jgi:uncharacterized protein
MSSDTGQFNWVELLTLDLAAATKFYTAVLGWSTEDVGPPGDSYRVVKAGEHGMGGMMTMPPEARARGASPCWLGYLTCPDVDRDAQRAVALGGRVLREPADIAGIGRFAVVADPTGAVFNLFTVLPRSLGPAASGEGSVGWYELHTSDWQRAFEFYQALCGWKKSRAMDMGAMGTYQLFAYGGADRGGIFNSPAVARARFWLTYFNTGNIDAAAARVTGHGGKILQGPVQVPTGGWIVQASDPEGVMFALVGVR